MDSCFAGSMKLQVLTTITSASSGRGVSWWPLDARAPIITSLSTRFLGQPKLTKPIFKGLLIFYFKMSSIGANCDQSELVCAEGLNVALVEMLKRLGRGMSVRILVTI